LSELSAGSAEVKCGPDAGDAKKMKCTVVPLAGQGAKEERPAVQEGGAGAAADAATGATVAQATAAPARGAAGISYIFLYR